MQVTKVPHEMNLGFVSLIPAECWPIATKLAISCRKEYKDDWCGNGSNALMQWRITVLLMFNKDALLGEDQGKFINATPDLGTL